MNGVTSLFTSIITVKSPSGMILGDKLDINFNREEIINTKTTKKQMWILLEILVSLVAIFYGVRRGGQEPAADFRVYGGCHGPR